MTHAVTDRDLSLLVEMVEEGRRQQPRVGLPRVMMQLATQLVPCDGVQFLELEPQAARAVLLQDDEDEPLVGVACEAVDQGAFWQHFWATESCSYSVVSGDTRTVTAISDFLTLREWRSTAMYADVLTGVDHEVKVCLTAPEGISRRLLFARESGPDFDPRERLILALLRPHLDELYQDLQRRRHEVPLTQRQADLLRLVASGLSNKEIARKLVISAATVRTHLENIFRLLDVNSRGAAVARAFPAPPY
jgi:DNA-binding CsgD family transcriptional regulator